MSAPNTNPEKQADQHRGPLTGMAMMVLFAAVLLVGFVIFLFSRGGSPEGAEAQVEDTTGAVQDEGQGGAVASDTASEEPAAGGADPAAVAVPAETTTAPETGGGNVADTDPGESQAAEPIDPNDGEGAGATAADGAEPAAD